MREKKSINFSTRWTESMDNAINDLSEVMMITKQDLVRIALSEYLTKQNNIIEGYREYMQDRQNYIYDDYVLGTINSGKVDESDAILGLIKAEGGNEYESVDELVTIDIVIPLKSDPNEIDDLFEKLKNCNKEEEVNLRKKLRKLIKPTYNREVTLKYTDEGVMVEKDPRFKVLLEKSIKDLIDKYTREGVISNE